MALPNMPHELKHVEIEVSLFCTEMENWQQSKLSIHIEEEKNREGPI
jgi:hypothetical protein